MILRSIAALRRVPAVDRAVALLAVTALFGAFVMWRFQVAGSWLPTLPERVGAWSSEESPLPKSALDLLGNPKATARVYTSPLGEKVAVNLVATGSFDAYHDPTICYPGLGYNQTAERLLPADGGREFRGMVYRGAARRDGVVVLYWLQHRDGSTSTDMRRGVTGDLPGRLRTGISTAFLGRQTVIVRVLTLCPPHDKNGGQALRNARAVAEAVLTHVSSPAERARR